MNVKLLTEHHLEFLSLKGDCTGSSESTLVKIPHCWKSRVATHIALKCETNTKKEKSPPKYVLSYSINVCFKALGRVHCRVVIVRWNVQLETTSLWCVNFKKQLL